MRALLTRILLGLPLLVARPALADPHPGLPPPARAIDLSTPRRAVRLFIDANRAGDPLLAAQALDLQSIPADKQGVQGPRLARELKAVLDQKLWVDYATIPDTPEGTPADGADAERIGSIELAQGSVPIVLAREKLRDGSLGWVFSSATVAAIPRLDAAYGPGWVERLLPHFFFTVRIWELELWQLLGLLLAVPLSLLLGALLAALGLRGLSRATSRTRAKWDDALVEAIRPPSRLLASALVFGAALEPLHLSAPAEGAAHQVLTVVLLGAAAWVAFRAIAFIADALEGLADADAQKQGRDELQIRGLRTQIAVLRRIANVVVALVSGSLMLLQFDVVRSVGVSLLASAGVAGIVLGLAAQKSIASLLAGIQLSITQPIRIGDTLIVEGEWGWVEEITLTYVVVKCWDERRLVVPISKFLESSFQNWTKVSPQLLGTVFVYADFTLPVELVRKILASVLEGNPRWDSRVQGVQVTNLSERTMEVRALVSAANADNLWDLRCEVREKLMAWLRDFEGGRYLPRARVDGPNDELARRAAG